MAINKFRYDINTLRAIAVISVVLFHYNIPGFSGGFSGVDVFFVISGYLMSQIIIGSIQNNRFSILDFYKKRMARIFPALIFLLLILTVVGAFLYFPPDYKLNEHYAAASLLFISNILYWRSLNYFGPAAGNNILLHTWSLSVEWQFYLVYPFILVAISKLKGKYKYLASLVVATIILFVLTVFLVRTSPVATFYLLPTRAWELFLGGIAFALRQFVKPEKNLKVLALTGYVLIVGSAVFLNSYYPWPGAFTFIPVAGTFMVIAAHCNSFGILKNPVVQLTGKISYSLYLWHWPVLVIFKYMGFDSSYITSLLVFSLSVTLAYFSYRYVEQSKTFTAPKNILILTSATLIFAITLSSFGINKIFFNKKALYFSAYTSGRYENTMKQFREGGCLFETRDQDSLVTAFNNNGCLTFDRSKKNILLIGDSHCAELYQSLTEAYPNVHFLQTTVTGWLPLEQPFDAVKDADQAGYLFHDFIPHNAKNIDGIILDGNWLTAYGDLPKLQHDLTATIKYLAKYGIKTIVIGQTEAYTIPYPVVLAKEYQYHLDLKAHFLDKTTSLTNKFLANALPLVYVDIYNTATPPLSLNNKPYMFDENHLGKYGADLAVKKILSNRIAINFFK